jgi:hypothetical protein
MSRVYSTRFMAGVPSGTPLLYTVPAGYKAVVRNIDIWQPITAVTNLVEVAVFGLAIFYVAYASATVQTADHWDGRQVLNAGDTLYASSNYALANLMASGYLLSLP